MKEKSHNNRKDRTDKEEFFRSVGWIVLSVVIIYLLIFIVMPDCSRYCASPPPAYCFLASMFGLLFMLIFLMSVIQIIIIMFRNVIRMVKKNESK